jgi:hypothetical protein
MLGGMRRYSEILRQSKDYPGDLYALLKIDFQFLETELGFERTECADGFVYASPCTLVYVRMWEEPWVGVDRVSSAFGKPMFGLPVWAAMNVRESAYLYNDAKTALDKFPVYAEALTECCSDLLSGNFSNVKPIVDWLRDWSAKREEWEESVLK